MFQVYLFFGRDLVSFYLPFSPRPHPKKKDQWSVAFLSKLFLSHSFPTKLKEMYASKDVHIILSNNFQARTFAIGKGYPSALVIALVDIVLSRNSSNQLVADSTYEQVHCFPFLHLASFFMRINPLPDDKF